MNGFIKKSLTGFLGAGLLSQAGCCWYRQRVDPCWPERYAHEARQAVNQAFDAQAMNGHALDQTVWNWHFEKETEVDAKTQEVRDRPTDRLHPAGIQHLNYLIRRRPSPDLQVFLQTSRDEDLDRRRAEAVQRYLNTPVPGRTPVTFMVQVTDPAEVGIAATAIGGNMGAMPVNGVINPHYQGFTAILPGPSGTSTSASSSASTSSSGGSGGTSGTSGSSGSQ